MNIAILLFLASLVMLTMVAAINLWLWLANWRHKKRIDKDYFHWEDYK